MVTKYWDPECWTGNGDLNTLHAKHEIRTFDSLASLVSMYGVFEVILQNEVQVTSQLTIGRSVSQSVRPSVLLSTVTTSHIQLFKELQIYKVSFIKFTACTRPLVSPGFGKHSIPYISN
jgi:hypothetical protein